MECLMCCIGSSFWGNGYFGVLKSFLVITCSHQLILFCVVIKTIESCSHCNRGLTFIIEVIGTMRCRVLKIQNLMAFGLVFLVVLVFHNLVAMA